MQSSIQELNNTEKYCLMSYLKVFTNTLTDTENHINIQNLFIEKGQRFFLIFFFKDTFKLFSGTE